MDESSDACDHQDRHVYLNHHQGAVSSPCATSTESVPQVSTAALLNVPLHEPLAPPSVEDVKQCHMSQLPHHHHHHHSHQLQLAAIIHHHQDSDHGLIGQEDIYKTSHNSDSVMCMPHHSQQSSRDPWVTPVSQHQVIILTSADPQMAGSDGVITSSAHDHLLTDSIWQHQTHHQSSLTHASSEHHHHHQQQQQETSAEQSRFNEQQSRAACGLPITGDPLAMQTALSQSDYAIQQPQQQQQQKARGCQQKSASNSKTSTGGAIGGRRRAVTRKTPSPSLASGEIGASSENDAAGMRRKRRASNLLAAGIDPSRLETCVEEVVLRFEQGCDCVDVSCFRSLNAESVFQHRLNIAELSRHEHDMYMMGVTVACLLNPDETMRHKERKRQRARYVYRGREVCLNAFLYLEKCTLYQLKRIRKHVMTHGVTPRVHGNHGKLPHNALSLDCYQHASNFVYSLIDKIKFAATLSARHCPPASLNRRALSSSSSLSAASAFVSSPSSLVAAPPDMTRKSVHESYLSYMSERTNASEKTMSYTLFLQFLRTHFPQLRFPKHHGPLSAGSGASAGDAATNDAAVANRGGSPATPGDSSVARPSRVSLPLSGSVHQHLQRAASLQGPSPSPPPADSDTVPVSRSACPLTPISSPAPTSCMSAVPDVVSSDYGVPVHHETTTYTVTQRPTVVVPVCDYVVDHQTDITDYHYSVSI